MIKNANILYLVGVDSYTSKNLIKLCNKDCFIIYQNSHGNLLANSSDVILPSNLFTEKVGTYINTEGRAQISSKILSSMDLSRDDSKIFNALGHLLKNSSSEDLINKISLLIPSTNSINKVQNSLITNCINFSPDTYISILDPLFLILPTKFNSIVEDFYLTSTLTRSSYTMEQCSKSLRKESSNFLR